MMGVFQEAIAEKQWPYFLVAANSYQISNIASGKDCSFY